VAAWRARLDAALPAGRFRVGLVWAGQARPWLPWFTTLDARRSTDAATLAPLASVPGVACVSLQKGASPPPWMLNPMSDATDFADTAAIVANLDVVVSVDTSMVHLAGALGKRVLLLDRYDSCWRWLSGRDDSPWYPSLTILRQPTTGDWQPVVARAAELLAAMAMS
jgi:hypothetical protein